MRVKVEKKKSPKSMKSWTRMKFLKPRKEYNMCNLLLGDLMKTLSVQKQQHIGTKMLPRPVGHGSRTCKRGGKTENNDLTHHTHWNCPPSVNPRSVASPTRSLSRPRLHNVHTRLPTKSSKDEHHTEQACGRNHSRKPKKRGGGGRSSISGWFS